MYLPYYENNAGQEETRNLKQTKETCDLNYNRNNPKKKETISSCDI